VKHPIARRAIKSEEVSATHRICLEEHYAWWHVPGRTRKLEARRDSECGVRTLTVIESLARDNGPKLLHKRYSLDQAREKPGG